MLSSCSATECGNRCNSEVNGTAMDFCMLSDFVVTGFPVLSAVLVIGFYRFKKSRILSSMMQIRPEYNLGEQ